MIALENDTSMQSIGRPMYVKEDHNLPADIIGFWPADINVRHQG